VGRKKIRLTIASLMASAFFFACPARTMAQQTATPSETKLPEAKLPEAKASEASLPDAPQTTGQVTGIVTDLDGDWIVNAQVTLAPASPSGPPSRTVVSNASGQFLFSDYSAGDLKLTVTAPNFATVVQLLTLRPGQHLDLNEIQLTAAFSTDIQVTLSQHDVAQIEIHEEEKQRILGVLPNFFVSYNWHAAPLSTRQKFELAWKSTLDPTSFLAAGAVAGIQQWQGDFKGYGQGAQGYGKRYGAAFADGAIGNMLGGAVYPTLFHQDPRYFYKGTGTIRRRALYAVAAAVICRGDNGRWQPNYSSVLGDFSAGAISNIYYPSTDRNGAGLTIENGFLGVVGDAVNNVIEEFVFRHITTNTHHQPPTTTTTAP
jgi:hypothetical protein